MPTDISARDAKGKSKDKEKAKNKDNPDPEVTYYCCSKVGHLKTDCWSWRHRRQPAKKDSTPKKGVTRKWRAEDVLTISI